MARSRENPGDPAPSRFPDVKAARRAIELLEVFGADQAWKSAGDLHRMTRIPRSSLHGLLRDLHAAGWIEVDGAGVRYRLGVQALTVGGAYLGHDPVIPYAAEVLECLRDRCGSTVHYARLTGSQVVYLQTRGTRDLPSPVGRVGHTMPAHATALGEAPLSQLPDGELTRLLPLRLTPLTAHTVVSRERLRGELELVRSRGYAVERGQSRADVACVAAVVPFRHPPTDAVGCSLPDRSATQADLDRLGLLREAAADLCSRLPVF